jgi:hypothetical protein
VNELENKGSARESDCIIFRLCIGKMNNDHEVASFENISHSPFQGINNSSFLEWTTFRTIVQVILRFVEIKLGKLTVCAGISVRRKTHQSLDNDSCRYVIRGYPSMCACACACAPAHPAPYMQYEERGKSTSESQMKS